MSNNNSSLLTKFAIDEKSLEFRKEFLRLTRDDAEILKKLVPWAQKHAKEIANEFYEWQFNFMPTLTFFKEMANQKNVRMADLRKSLEAAQEGYYLSIFEGAQTYWDGQYFERRLHVGTVHNKINLPLKWYVGSYIEFQRLTKSYFKKIKPEDYGLKKEDIAQAEVTVLSVFNYDMQAICDAFFGSLIESIGFSIEHLQTENGKDRLEYLKQIKEEVDILVNQGAILAAGDLKNEKLEKEINGTLGKAFTDIKHSLSILVQQGETIAEGNLIHEVLDTKVEGDLGDAFQRLKGSITKTVSEFGTALEKLTINSNEIESSGVELKQAASKTGELTEKTANAVLMVDENISSVSSAAEEMSVSIREITTNVHRATEVANQAKEIADSTCEVVNTLSESSKDIGKVVNVITNIAEQTNLLALNATIEAARAGESGKGFGVVANEVKLLAKNTADATGEISQKIEAIQSSSSEVIKSIEQISEVINEINKAQLSIASAMEEQTTTMNEIAKNMADTSTNSKAITEHMSEVKDAVNITMDIAERSNKISTTLKDITSALNGIIAVYKYNRTQQLKVVSGDRDSSNKVA